MFAVRACRSAEPMIFFLNHNRAVITSLVQTRVSFEHASSTEAAAARVALPHAVRIAAEQHAQHCAAIGIKLIRRSIDVERNAL